MKMKECLNGQKVIVRPEAINDARIAAVIFGGIVFLASSILLCYAKLWDLENRVAAQRNIEASR
jgi:hypothetical protein